MWAKGPVCTARLSVEQQHTSRQQTASHMQEIRTINLCGEKLIDNTMIGQEGVSTQIIWKVCDDSLYFTTDEETCRSHCCVISWSASDRDDTQPEPPTSRLPLSSMWLILLGAHARMCFKSRQKADCLKYLDIYSAIEKGQVPSRAGSHFTLFFCVEMKALRPHKVVKYKKKRWHDLSLLFSL